MLRILFICFLFYSGNGYSTDRYKRDHNVDIIHYDFNVFLNDTTDIIEGTSVIRAGLKNTAAISLDLKNISAEGKGMTVLNVSSTEGHVTWKHQDDRISILFEHNITGETEITIQYKGIPVDGLIISKNKFGKRVFFADHWPDRAHNYLPCVDHPYDKATVDFIVSAPIHYKVVGSGTLKSEIPAGQMKVTHWSEREPLPVKIMAFGVADFAVSPEVKVNDIPVNSWVFAENRSEGFSDYAVAVKPLKWYAGLIGAFPFEKLANVQSKTIYGGLENASCIFYSENSVTGKGTAESLIAHEIAHQWFGDCVTENDWSHVWLSEGFATYLTSMYFESKSGREALKKDMSSTRERVLRYWERNKKPVIDTTVTNLMSLLNANSYQKGGWVLHMLRNEVGDSAFVKGLRLFYKRYAYDNVVTDDFRKVMEETSGKDLGQFFRQWLYKPGQPELKISREQKGKNTILVIEQVQENLFSFNLEVQVKTSRGPEILSIPVNSRTTWYGLRQNPKEIIPDPAVKLLYKLVSVQ